MKDLLDFRYGIIEDIKCLSSKQDSPRRKYCKILIRFEELGVTLQSIGQFYHHLNDLKGKMVLCLINLPPRNMFGQLSEVLVLGVPHKAGGIIESDEQEAQATYLRPIAHFQSHMPDEKKDETPYESWANSNLLVGLVTKAEGNLIKVRLGNDKECDVVVTDGAEGLVGQQIVVGVDDSRSQIGWLPSMSNGAPLFVQPSDECDYVGDTVY